MAIRFDTVTMDEQKLPVVCWEEDRNIFAPEGIGPARVACFIRPDKESGELMFVAAGSGIEIVREGTRTGHRYQLLGTLRGPSRRMEPLLVTLTERTEVFPLFQHDGTELIYMLDGVMRYGSGMTAYLLQQGDALQFDGSVAHGPAELIELPIRFLSVIATANGTR